MVTFTRGTANKFSKFDPVEGVLTGNKIINFAEQSKQVYITNDAPGQDLLYKFSVDDEFGTLKPTETVDLPFQTTQVFLSSRGANFRVWGYR